MLTKAKDIYEGNITENEIYKEIIKLLNVNYELDHFQKYAAESILNMINILLTAHTGSGKTIAAEIAILYTILYLKKKVVYNSPIKALSNQKFQELTEKYSHLFSIGLMTGDNKINPDAQCVIMTTEILRNALFNIKNEKTKKDIYFEYSFVESIGCVVFDEVHWIGDKDRGHVWQESLNLINRDVLLVLLSATISNAESFAYKLSVLKQKEFKLITTTKRVIPLTHSIFLNNYLYPILDNNNKFNDINFDLAKKEEKILNKTSKNYSHTHMLNQVANYLKTNNLLQTIFFCFSTNKCEEYARAINLDLITYEERSEIERLYRKHMFKYEEKYVGNVNYHNLKMLITKGVAYHHSGVINIFKEFVEILFKASLIKILFATETFSVGVNMPTRTVVFTGFEKPDDNNKKRLINTAEYKQMSGRAGRRGIDIQGDIILLPLYEFPNKDDLKLIMTGNVPNIEFNFNIEYKFLLQTIQSKSTNIRDFLEKSLSNQTNNEIIEQEKKLLATMQKEYDGIQIDQTKLSEFNDIFAKNLEEEELKKTGFGVKTKKTTKLSKENKKLYEKYMKKISLGIEIDNLKKSIIYMQNTDADTMYQLINCLYELGYLTSIKTPYELTDTDVTIKGIIASQINAFDNPIILTEMIVQKVFDDLSPEEIVALLALFIDDTVRDEEGEVTCSQNVIDKINDVNYIIDNCINVEKKHGLDLNNYNYWDIYYDFVDIAYHWTAGKQYNELGYKYEGKFARNILKLKDIVHDLACLCEIFGNKEILPKLEVISQLLVRSIVTNDSLYLTTVK